MNKILENFVYNHRKYEYSLNPNGFITIKLDEKHWLRIWSNVISKNYTIGTLFNDNKTFITKIIYGKIWQYRYSSIPYSKKRNYTIYYPDTIQNYGMQLELIPGKLEKYIQGEQFLLHTGTYTCTWTDKPSCAILSVINTRKAFFDARIAVPINLKPKMNVSKNLHPSAIPLIIKNAAKRIIEKIN